MEYLKNSYDKSLERGMDLAGKPLTPKSERPRASYGSLQISMQTTQGLCEAGLKCVRHDGHAGDCYPED